MKSAPTSASFAPRPRLLPTMTVSSLALVWLAACATVGPTRPITEYRTIAGNWQGYGGTQQGTGPVQLTIREDGSGEFFLPRPNIKAPVSFTIDNGRLVYETAMSTGTATLHEEGEQRRLRGKATRKDGSGGSWFDLKPANK